MRTSLRTASWSSAAAALCSDRRRSQQRSLVAMGSLFSRKSPRPAVSQQDIAVLQLKQLRDKMKQAQKRVGQQMDQDRDVARKLIADGKKDRALLLLKRKKRMEKSLLDLDGKLEVLEKMVSDIEFSQIEMKLIDGLKTGNTALKQLNQLLNIENVQSILEETKESADRQKEITDLLTDGSFSAEDDQELEEELQQLTAVHVNEVLPAVPSHEVAVHERESEETAAPVRRKEPKRQAAEAI